MKKKILWLLLDFTVAVLLVLAVWMADYKLAQEGIKAVTLQRTWEENKSEQEMQDWHDKFAGKFTDVVIVTDTSYTSPNLSIQLSYNHYDTGITDHSEGGKHEKYGTQVSYVLADIYIGDITCFQTAFAQDMYGVGYSVIMNLGIIACWWWTADRKTAGECFWMRWQGYLKALAARPLTIWTAATAHL